MCVFRNEMCCTWASERFIVSTIGSIGMDAERCVQVKRYGFLTLDVIAKPDLDNL